jgi:TRAP-type mannitol/chloroaromatic compound transport system permease large subunit
MFTPWSWISLAVALTFYVYYAWVAPVAKPGSARELAVAAGWAWAVAVGAAAFAFIWGATRGNSWESLLLSSVEAGKFENFVVAARSLVILALLFSIHALAALLVTVLRDHDIGD